MAEQLPIQASDVATRQIAIPVIVPVRHKTCWNIVMYYAGEREESRGRSCDIVYLDGESPLVCSAIQRCPFCGGSMAPGLSLERCWAENMAPA